MFNEKVLDDFLSKSNPLKQICSKDYIHGVYMFGSFLSVLHNKRLNPSAIFVLILDLIAHGLHMDKVNLQIFCL